MPGYEASGWSASVRRGTRRWRSSRNAEQGDQRGARGREIQGATCRHWRRAACRVARRLSQAHRRRNREVGQSDQVRRYQSGVIPPAYVSQSRLPIPSRADLEVMPSGTSGSKANVRCREPSCDHESELNRHWPCWHTAIENGLRPISAGLMIAGGVMLLRIEDSGFCSLGPTSGLGVATAFAFRSAVDRAERRSTTSCGPQSCRCSQ